MECFRVDTVKHMDLGATRLLHLGHPRVRGVARQGRFYLIGEITCGLVNARTGRSISRDSMPRSARDTRKLEYLVKGYREPAAYFDLFPETRSSSRRIPTSGSRTLS